MTRGHEYRIFQGGCVSDIFPRPSLTSIFFTQAPPPETIRDVYLDRNE